jgi:hypothetical protein
MEQAMNHVKRLTNLLFNTLLFGAAASAMEMQIMGDQLIASSYISEGDYGKFIQTITPAVKTVVFTNSPGGPRLIGQDLAEEIRQRKLSTVVLGYCFSSCANAFLGGVERRLANGESFLGYHGNYVSGRRWPSRRFGGEVKNFYYKMTGGKLSDEMIELFLSKPKEGFVAFYQRTTRDCSGKEAKRPFDCPTFPVSAIEAGILTDLSDVQVNER